MQFYKGPQRRPLSKVAVALPFITLVMIDAISQFVYVCLPVQPQVRLHSNMHALGKGRFATVIHAIIMLNYN